MLIQPLLLRRALICAQLALLASCGTDEERTLTFGPSSDGSGSAGNLTSGGSSQGAADSGDAGEAPSDGGANGASAGSGASSSDAGAPDQDGGAPGTSTGGKSSVAGSNSVAGGENVAGSGSMGGTGTMGGSAGTAGSSSVAGSGVTAGTGNGVGGSGGTGPDLDSGPCGDLDADGVQDCDETTALNPRFDLDAKSWLADYGVTQAWQSDDARAKAGSGSLKVTFTSELGAPSSWALAAAGQCVPAWGEDVYEVGARARVASGMPGGQAVLSLAFFGNDGCVDFLGTITVQSTQIPGVWAPLRGSVKAPAGARSVLVRLAASKPGSQASLEVHFDDVLFRKK